MKKLLLIALLALSTLVAKADGVALTSLTAGVASNLLSGTFIVDKVAVIATTTNITTVKFYDTSNTTTSYVAAAYTRYTGYATNFSNIFTNEAGLLITNTYAGWYTAPVSVSAATNSRPVLYQVSSPASSILSQDVKFQTIRGLAAVPDQDCQVVITYRNAN